MTVKKTGLSEDGTVMTIETDGEISSRVLDLKQPLIRVAGDEDVGNQSHYTSHKIQPIDFITENNMNFLEGNIIKYVTRYKLKNGLEDLKKAQQYLTWLIKQYSLEEENNLE